MMRVSVIIPALNEEAALPATLARLNSLATTAHEIIVVDGKSEDATVDVAENYNVRVISAPRGRAAQMNAGAAAATGDILCFLHADTLLPTDAVPQMQQTFDDPSVSCGGFRAVIQGVDKTWSAINFHHYIKTWYVPLMFRPHLFFRGLRVLFGDQVIFCRREAFEAIAGFDESMLVMEETDLCIRLIKARTGRIKMIKREVITSDRRIATWGGWKSTAIHLFVAGLWLVGVSPMFLKRFYADFR